ncbi:unnamed protein product [Rotaria socialis]|uniref:ABC transporter domain-containing protein n=1 Tax=Rotaria socialis TaxID=392032 RepID=A0A820UP30_9BILA|nr:unnamed protein product [Rotaria socialis]
MASLLAVEVINDMRTIKQLSIEKEVLRKYSECNHQVFLMPQKTSIMSALYYDIYWTMDTYTMAFVYWRALGLVESEELDSQGIILTFTFIIFSMQPLRSIGILSRCIVASLSAAETVFNLFDRKPIIDNDSDAGLELSNFRGEIKFDQVKFIYPTRSESIILDKSQLNITPSYRVAHVGETGSGKSTTMQLLQRFYDATKGNILLDDVDIRTLNIHGVRSQFSLVSQESILFDLTTAANVAYGIEEVPMDDIINAVKRANIHHFIEQLLQIVFFLSGDEKQRIAIARVLICRPKVLLLDEATSATDSHNEQIVREALEQAQTEDQNRASLIISHRLSTIRSCDSICVLDKGKVIENGTHTELFVTSTDPNEFTNFDLNPKFAILNSTSTTKFLCTKSKEDDLDFDISLIPAISSKNLKVYKNLLNHTAMEILIESSGYIGAFHLICSSITHKSASAQSDITIAPPDLFKRVGGCVVYENKYINCKIYAPEMVAGIQNQNPHYFDFRENHEFSKENFYHERPELIEIDIDNKTLTFRWLPKKDGAFPLNLEMLVHGTLQYFDSTYYILNMTPSFFIKPNFTIQYLSSTNFKVHFNHGTFSSPLLCRGNLTRDDKLISLKQEQHSRTFYETNQTTISINNLTPNTSYQLCFECHQDPSVTTITELQCTRVQTKQSWNWLIYLIICIVIMFSLLGVFIILGRVCYFKYKSMKRQDAKINAETHEPGSQNSENPIELQPLKSAPVELADIAENL